MREIKFRVWDKKRKQMFYSQWCLTLTGGLFQIANVNWAGDSKNLTLIQYTGLYDRNGKEICEGDIIKDGYDEPLGIVIFEDGCFVIESLDDGGYTHYPETRILHFEACEITGNIYENSEYLEGRENERNKI